MTTERNEAMVEIHTLRHRRQELVGELVRVDAHIAALGATPDRRTLIERILTASQTVGLSTTEHTRALGLHEYYRRLSSLAAVSGSARRAGIRPR